MHRPGVNRTSLSLSDDLVDLRQSLYSSQPRAEYGRNCAILSCRVRATRAAHLTGCFVACFVSKAGSMCYDYTYLIENPMYQESPEFLNRFPWQGRLPCRVWF